MQQLPQPSKPPLLHCKYGGDHLTILANDSDDVDLFIKFSNRMKQKQLGKDFKRVTSK